MHFNKAVSYVGFYVLIYSIVAALLDCLEDLDKFGLVLLENGPLHTGPVADLQVTVCLHIYSCTVHNLVCFGWFGLVGLVGFGLVWFGLVWFGLVGFVLFD